MNFGFLSLLLQNPLQGAIVLTCVLFGMVLHNVVQALLADRLGDSTSRTYGFHGTDPRIHLDGLTLAFVVLLGFGRPNSIPLRGSSLRGRGGNSEAMVWLSGPLGMIVFALVLKLVAGGVALLPNELAIPVAEALTIGAYEMVYFAVVYIFPVPPLDGARALAAVGSMEARRFLSQLESYGPIGYLLTFLVLSFTGILSAITVPVVNILSSIVKALGLPVL
jgi:Zn-dependent protease